MDTRNFRKIIIRGILVFAIVIAAILVTAKLISEPLPNAQPSKEADILGKKMLKAINHQAWENTRYVSWTFAGLHSYVWDKARHQVRVTYGDMEVFLDTEKVSGKAYNQGTELTGEAADEEIQTAWEYFCNDSYWLCAPNKIFDPGTERSIVSNETYDKALLVTYNAGGVTPGDSYLWILDDHGLPVKFKMWVDIIPIGGMEATFEGWKTLPGGAKIATQHQTAILTVKIDDLLAGNTLSQIGIDDNLFDVLN